MTSFQVDRIAHPTDLSDECEGAYVHALRLAGATGAHLDLIHVDPAPHVVTPEHFPSPEKTLDEWQLKEGGKLGKIKRITAFGKEPVKPIVSYLDESMPDMLVLATHRHQGLARWLHREVAQKIPRERNMPTLFVPVGEEGFVSPSTGRISLRKILVPVDWIPSSQPAVDMALNLAGALGATPLELTLFHVGEPSSEVPGLDWPERDGLRVVRSTREGDVVDEVVRQAQEIDADLVAMVTEGRHGFLEALRGSTTEQVLRRLDCPLLVIPDPAPAGAPIEI